MARKRSKRAQQSHQQPPEWRRAAPGVDRAAVASSAALAAQARLPAFLGRVRASLRRPADSRSPARASPATQAAASLMQITAVETQKHGEGKLQSALKGPHRLLGAKGREADE